MLKKIHWIMMNVVTFILILLLLFLPLFDLKSIGSDNIFGNKMLFGFHFLTGYTTKNANGEFVQIIASKLVGFVPVMMLLSMWIVSKLTKSNLRKDVINFLCLAVSFVFVFLLPVIAPTFLNENYQEMFEFSRLGGYWVNLILVGIVFIYYIVILIYNIIKTYRENKEDEKRGS